MARTKYFISGWKYAWVLAGIASLVFIFAIPSGAQVASGSIVGSVRDASGAVVIGATVTVRNTETGIAHVVKSNTEGQHVVTLLQPGTYSVTVERQGFKKAVQPAFKLEIGRASWRESRAAKATDIYLIGMSGAEP